MPTVERLEQGLRAALDKGMTKQAEVLRQALAAHPDYPAHRQAKLESVQEQIDPPINPALGTARSALQGLTFGFSDELGAGTIAGIKTAGGGFKNFPQTYRQYQQKLSGEQQQFEEDHPVISAGAEMAGGALTGGAGLARTLGRTAGKSLATRGAATVGTGILEGGTYGAGTAQPGETIKETAIGAGLGAVAAPVGAVAGKVVGEALPPIFDWGRRTIFSAPKEQASRFLHEGLSQEGFSPSALAQALRESDDAILADASISARNALEGVIQQGDSPAIEKQARELFDQRKAGQQPRLIGDLQENIGTDAGLRETIERLGQQRSSIAGPLYQQAYQQPLRNTEKMQSLMRAPAIGTALKQAETIVANKRIAGDRISHMQLFDAAKQSLDDQIGVALRSGERGKARDLIRLKSDLVDELDKQVPAYKQARDAFAGPSALMEAAEQGRRILLDDADYTADLLKGMSNSEKEMFRVGAGRAIRDKLMQASVTGDAAKRLNSGLLRERIKNAFPSEEAFNQFMEKVEIEQNIFSTSAILQNSATARRLQEFKRMEGVDIPGIEGGATGITVGLFKKILGSGLNDEAKEELGRLTMQRLKDFDLNELSQQINKAGMSEEWKEWSRERLKDYAATAFTPAALAPVLGNTTAPPMMEDTTPRPAVPQSPIGRALREAAEAARNED